MNIDLKLNPQLKGSVQIPASKSYAQRALAAALLHNGTSLISGLGTSEDERAALEIIQRFGAKVVYRQDQVLITSNGKISATTEIDCKESGLAARLFIPIAALSNEAIIITGEQSLRRRPMDFYETVFSSLSVGLTTTNGRLPFSVKGPIQPKSIKVTGNQSSQFVSGLLFALSNTYREDPLILEVEGLVSKPYVDMTIAVLKHWGKRVDHKDYREFYIKPLRQEGGFCINYSIEADWSSAAFWIAAAAIGGEIVIKGLNKESKQADRKMMAVLHQVGAYTTWNEDHLLVAHQTLNAFDVDLKDSPDLFPVLSILAASCAGVSRLSSVHRLWHKESNRADEIISLLHQLGASVSIDGDVMIIEGVSEFKSIHYQCPNDHRMAMAATLSTLRTSGKSRITGADCVRKSYPDFWAHVAHFGQVRRVSYL